MWTTRLFASVFLLYTAQGCPDLSETSCSVSLTSLDDLYGEDLAGEDAAVVCVDLPANSSPSLSYRDTNLTFSVVVIRGNNSTVTCDRVDGDIQGSSSFPLQFQNASMVVITDIHFEKCQRPLRFKMVQTIQISSSNFSNFCCGGALEISNSPNVCIQDSQFTNDTSFGFGNSHFSGNAGGVAIGYDQPGHLRMFRPNVMISRCTFVNNTANATEENRLTVLFVLTNRIYNQRGGGVAVYFGAENYGGVVRIENSQFINNTAEDSGGGIYMFLDGPQSSHRVIIYNTTFTGNTAQDGGGLEITHSNPDSLQNPNYVDVINCMFTKNWGKFGGGYKNIQLNDVINSNHLYVRNTTFDDNVANVGAGIYLQSVITVEKTTLLNRIGMEDCRFTHNNGKRGVMFVIGNVVTINGSTVFHGSIGPALRILGTLVILDGNILFEENRHDPEGFSGALYLSSFAQIVLRRQTNITFLYNNGTEGACIVVRGQLIAAAFTKQLYNPQCFLQYEEPTEQPSEWNVNITFKGNRANVGPAVLLSDKDICLWNSSTSPFFSEDLESTWEGFMEMGNNFINGVEQETDSNIQTGIFSLTLDPYDDYQSAYPGQTVSIMANALDQFDRNTTAFIGIDTAFSYDDSITNFEPSIVQISPQNNIINFKFLGSEENTNTTVKLNAFFTSDPNETTEFTLHHDPCNPGHSLNESACKCNGDPDVILCQDDGLLLDDGLWGASPRWCSELVKHPCPPGYCSCNGIEDMDIKEGCHLPFKEPQSICIEERRTENQILCGSCMEDYGVGLLTNRCQKHGPDNYYWLIPIYVILLVISLVALVKLGIHLPTVLRGFLFYIQIAPIAMAYFPGSFNLNTAVLSCVGSTLALYVPYDFTFHQNMSSLESYALRYSAPIIALVVVPLSTRFRQHRSKYWHGVWTIILLMYVMSLETSISLLFCPTLNCKSEDKAVSVWFFDGSVRCYRGWHIPLAIVALVCLLLQALLLLLVVASIYYKTLRKKYIKFEKLESFSIVITQGIKKEYRWWPILELGCRFIFILAVVLSAGVVVVPLVLSMPIFMLQAFIHPYESKVSNYLESFLFLWLVCLLGLSNTTVLQDQIKANFFAGIYGTTEDGAPKGPWWPNALLYIPVAVGFVVLMVHFVFLFRKLFLTHKDKIKRKLKMKTSESVSKLRAGLSSSYSSKKLLLINQGADPKITKTVVGLDDADEDISTEL